MFVFVSLIYSVMIMPAGMLLNYDPGADAGLVMAVMVAVAMV